MALFSYSNDQYLWLIIHAWVFMIGSLLLNMIALYLATFHSHQNIGKYRYILYSFLWFNVFFSILNSFCDLELTMSGRSLILVGTVNLNDETTSIILFYLTTFTFFETVLLATGQIVHRCLIVYGKIRPENTLLGAVGVLFITFLILALWIVLFIETSITTSMCVNKFDDYRNFTLTNLVVCQDFMEQLSEKYNFNTASFVSIPFEILDEKTNKFCTNIRALMLFILLCFLLIGSIVIVILCTYWILKKSIQIQSSKLSVVQQNLHTEMLKTLLGQALSPILLLHLPLLISSIATVIDKELNWMYFSMYFTLAWFPAVQPIVLIFGVGSYRKKVLQLFVLFLHEARIISKIRVSKLSSVNLKEDTTSTHSSRITTSVHGH